MTERAHESSDEQKFLRRIKRSLAAAYKQVRKYAKPWGSGPPIYDMKVFTDNIVVAYPLGDLSDLGEPELGALLVLFAYVQASLAADGFFLRGGIAAGKHYQDRDIAYGEALLEAHDLDKSGGPPRLVIGASVEPLISGHLAWYLGGLSPHHHYLLEDPTDGRLFLNYLGVAFEDFPDMSPIDLKLLKAHSTKVTEALQEYESDMRVRPKYTWLAAYHNYVCRTFAAQYPVRCDEEADLWEMDIREEAQRVLDHLVAFDEEQPPRPLDAQRLQQRLATNLDLPSV